MINSARLVKVSMVWMSITYLICYMGVALMPGIRQQFMLYALHTNIEVGKNALSLTNFITGLVAWNLITGAGVWLFGMLYNQIKE